MICLMAIFFWRNSAPSLALYQIGIAVTCMYIMIHMRGQDWYVFNFID
ncbi:hypothetical protein HMPREF0080_01573 [Anaeroglobus geminatus F0357]|uniref:Uncharacterized protein n=1 Tax=Anaeroglobus geminatus F0357 TaxID=861450 RepID=G9YIS9_9FIRM|nr:hypothetical protein HMPREF0080_01573 [Anaeroglobus geminatus F0357]